MFSGIGGFELGIGDKAECVGYSEIDKYAIKIYEKHFPNHTNFGDCTTIKPEELPDFDLIVGGFPCQAFSIAGKRRGFNDTRGTLFFDIARILKEKQPRLLLLENVKGLLSHDNGRTFKTIVSTLTELGYDVQWQVLNSKNFGVPQNRERVFIIGHLRGTSRPKVFPIFGTNSKDIIVNGVLDTETWRKRHEQIRRIHSIDGISPTLPTGMGGGVMTKIEITDDGRLGNAGVGEDYPFGQNNGGNTSTSDQCESSILSHPTIKVRRLTPTECMRLQGFPDNWCDGISDSQKYKCAGNAVTVNVIKAIIDKLFPS